jgi:MinD superfamily P-loop ATPase
VTRIAVASGKGGTGKTTVATNLARVLADLGERVAYLDCDVEAPDGHVFLSPAVVDRREVSVGVVEIDSARCRACGACARACRFGAVLSLPETSVVFPDLCHGCGGCLLACPTGAAQEIRRPVGVVETGHSGRLTVCQGWLAVGRTAEHEVVRAVRAAAPTAEVDWVVLDAPPGVGCPVVETVRDTDVVLLVTEPTPAGLHDLALAAELAHDLAVPCGVVLNRAGERDVGVRDFCSRQGITVLAEIPDDIRVARAYSRGQLVVDTVPGLRGVFQQLAVDLAGFVHRSAARSATRPRASLGTAVVPGEDLDDPMPPPSETADGLTRPPVHELVVLSGKGGTGKTSIVACLAFLAEDPAMVDADVDAANLHLMLDSTPRGLWPFTGGQVAVVDPVRCTGCGLCTEYCRFDALRLDDPEETSLFADLAYIVDPAACEGCGVCVDTCPEHAVTLVPHHSGLWFTATTRLGPFTHARLHPGGRNSGKLVTLVRDEGQALARGEECRLLITDGPPGTGCPAMAALNGAGHALLVTEPTVSGLGDLRRVIELTRQLDVPAAVCINKADLNPGLAAQVEVEAAYLGLPILGRVRYDESVVAAQLSGTCVVDHAPESRAAGDIRALWRRVQTWIGDQRSQEPLLPTTSPRTMHDPKNHLSGGRL